MKQRFRHVILGGTFDRFHAGHEIFVKTALESGDKVTIGIATEPLYRRKTLASMIEPYEARERAAARFVTKIRGNLENVSFIPLSDVYGSGLTDKSAEAIVVTEATVAGADSINRKREEAGRKPLSVVVVPLLKGEDGLAVSSERIRYGDIDRRGFNYYEYLLGSGKLVLPEPFRIALREPLGDVFPGTIREAQLVVKKIRETIGKQNPPLVIAIGDIITRSLQTSGYKPGITIVDRRSRREALPVVSLPAGSGGGEVFCRNGAGTIEASAIRCLKLVRDGYLNENRQAAVIVEGEEDLLALPVILLAPLQSVVLYGQYDLGVIAVTVTEDVKKRVLALLDNFSR